MYLMKRNLKEEIRKIWTCNVYPLTGEVCTKCIKERKQLLTLFSKTLDYVSEQAKPIYIDRGNTVGDRKAGREEATKEYEQNLRARKKGVGL